MKMPLPYIDFLLFLICPKQQYGIELVYQKWIATGLQKAIR